MDEYGDEAKTTNIFTKKNTCKSYIGRGGWHGFSIIKGKGLRVEEDNNFFFEIILVGIEKTTRKKKRSNLFINMNYRGG